MLTRCVLCATMRFSRPTWMDDPEFNPLRALKLMRLLDPSPVEVPRGAPQASETRGHWLVSHYDSTTVWQCRCRRSRPLLVAKADLSRVKLPRGLQACEICQHDDETARRKSRRLTAWIERHRYCLDPDQHLYLPEDLGFCRLSGAKNKRTRRFVYEIFWRTELAKDQFVLPKCGDKNCLNPYHLRVATSPAQKLTDEKKRLILLLAEKQVSSRTIQQVLQEQHSLKLSIRTVQQVVSETSGCRSSAT